MKRVKLVWKIFKKILFWIFFINLFLVTTITVILHIYEDDINQFAIDELNSYLKTDVKVRQMDVTIFHEFPNASIAFENVFIADSYETVQSNDTLLFAEHLYFYFNLWDIMSGDYKVKRVSMDNGQLNLKTTLNGDINFGILKDEEDTTESPENFEFLIELLKLENIDFALFNQSTNQDYQIKVKNARISGDFNATQYDLKAEGDLHVDRLKSNSLTLISNKSATLDLGLAINTEKASYTFKKGDLTVDKMDFKITGAIDSSSINLDLIGENIEISQVVESILPAGKDGSKQYKGDGLVNFIGKIEGPLSRLEMPSITADFAVSNGVLSESDSKLRIYDIHVKGNYSNAFGDRTEQLNIKTFKLKLLNSHLNGTARINDFAQPVLSTHASGNMDLGAFHRFFGFKGVENLAGNVELDLGCSIRFFDPEYRKDKFEILSSNGNFTLNKVVFKSVASPIYFKNITGQMVIQEKDAAVKDFLVKTQKSDLLFNGALKNLLAYIDGSGSLGMIASVESDHIDLNEFLGPSNKEKEGPLTQFELPGNLNLNLELKVKNFDWDKHNLKEISGQLLWANRTITVNQLRLKTLEGDVVGKLVLTNKLEQGNIIEGQAKFNSINIKKLFSEWDNFQQQSITDKHLSGIVSGNIELALLFNPYFSLVEERIFALSNIRIVNGELNNLETMKAVTDYMRSNKALKLMLNKHIDQFEDKLMHLKFSEINNQIEIKDRRINIPKMTIKTNALDVELFGWHDFDNNIEYHFSFRFNQLKSKPEYTEFGKVVDDGLGIMIYMTMSGTIDEPVFSLDKEERKNDIKESVEQEKQNMKSMLKTEFGLFQKDSTVKQMQLDNKKEVEFIYYETDLESEEADTTQKKTKNKKRSSTFFDKLKQEADKNKPEVEYEDE